MNHSSRTPKRVHPQSAASHPPAPPAAPPDGPSKPPASPRIVAGLCDFTDVDTIYEPHYRTLHITTATFKRHHHFLDQANPIPTDDIVAAADAIYAELDDDREHFTILTCDARPQIYGFKVVASGSICRVDVAHDTAERHLYPGPAQARVSASNTAHRAKAAQARLVGAGGLSE